MADDGAVVVVGGTRAIGLELVKHFARHGDEVVLTGQDPANVAAALNPISTWVAEKRASDEVRGAAANPAARPNALTTAVMTMPRLSTSRPMTTPPAKKPSVFMV